MGTGDRNNKTIDNRKHRVKSYVNDPNNEHIKIANDLTKIGGMSGTNYSDGNSYDALHKAYPDWFLYGSETASSVNSRGVIRQKRMHH